MERRETGADAVEILAMVLGFIVFWPIGLAVLGWKFWQKKSGYPGDIILRRDLAELKEMVRLGAGIPGDEQRIEMIKGLLAR